MADNDFIVRLDPRVSRYTPARMAQRQFAGRCQQLRRTWLAHSVSRTPPAGTTELTLRREGACCTAVVRSAWSAPLSDFSAPIIGELRREQTTPVKRRGRRRARPAWADAGIRQRHQRNHGFSQSAHRQRRRSFSLIVDADLTLHDRALMVPAITRAQHLPRLQVFIDQPIEGRVVLVADS